MGGFKRRRGGYRYAPSGFSSLGRAVKSYENNHGLPLPSTMRALVMRRSKGGAGASASTCNRPKRRVPSASALNTKAAHLRRRLVVTDASLRTACFRLLVEEQQIIGQWLG